jgi:ubiquinone biosynthesis protein
MELLSALAPRRLRRYRQITQTLVRYGFGFLVQQARPSRLGARRGRPEPPTPPPARYLVQALEELGPTFVKLGQILSTRPDLLPPAFVAELSRLQDHVASFPFAQARVLVETELGAPLAQLFASFEPVPLAAASLAQVHAATLPDGSEVVVKVQRPGIEDLVATDLDILHDLAQLAEEQFPELELYDIPSLAEEFAHTLRGELDFRREGHNADRFRRNFAGNPTLYIPRVYWELSTQRVLTLERIRGIKIDDLEALAAAGLDRHRLALHATEIVMQEVFEDGFFHADPHPGNLAALPGEAIAAMDFGMVGRLARPLREQMVPLFTAVVRRDAEAIVEHLLRLSIVGRGVDRAGLRHDLEWLLQKYAGRPLSEIRANEVLEQALPIAFRRRLRLPNDLWLLSRMLGVLEGLGLKLDPGFDPFTIARPYAERFIQEMLSPAALARRAAESVGDWADLLLDLPTTVPAIVGQLQRGDLSVGMEIRRAEGPPAALDLLAMRLALGLLLSAMLVVTALFLRPLITPGVWWGWALVGMGGVALLGVLASLLWTLRGGRRD